MVDFGLGVFGLTAPELEVDKRLITVLGSTGSIGVNTLDVIARHPDLFSVYALTANHNIQLLVEQCVKFKPRFAVVADPAKVAELRELLAQSGCSIDVLAGKDALSEVAAAESVHMVMAAIVGAAGLLPTLAAVNSGKRVLLANKEALVMAGSLFIDAVRSSGAELLPIDSEHNAIFQCLPSQNIESLDHGGIRKILLTASGGPFLNTPAPELKEVTPEQACNHPNWDMGRKISVDSATMMNKGLELIEACWLFNTSPQRVQVVIHPESVVHSMVEYVDGSVLAQMGNPDMRTPIAHGLAWPARIESGVKSLDFMELAGLHFEAPDLDRFPCLRLAAEAFELGGTAAAILNAANEVAVQAFLDGKIRFTSIAGIVEDALNKVPHKVVTSLEQVLEADEQARKVATMLIARSNS